MSYARYDEDPWADVEALEDERRWASLEQAQLEEAGRAITRARKRGVCTHVSAVGYVGVVIYPEQEGLRRGEVRCTAGCGRVFGSDEEWCAAIDEAVYGT